MVLFVFQFLHRHRNRRKKLWQLHQQFVQVLNKNFYKVNTILIQQVETLLRLHFIQVQQLYYVAGGATLTNAGVSLSSTTAFTDFDDVSYSSASFTANGALIYNTTTDGGSGTTDAVCVIAFGGDKTATNGTFTIQFPAADASNAILRLA
jgi:hypothetical protein